MMDDIEKTLLTILRTQWALTGDYAADTVTFTRSEWRAESGGALSGLRVEVGHVGETRLQTVNDHFEYAATVTVRVWPTGSDDAAITVAKDKVQTLIEEIKRIVALYPPRGSEALPSGWDWMLYMGSRNVTNTQLTKPVIGEALRIAVRHFGGS